MIPHLSEGEVQLSDRDAIGTAQLNAVGPCYAWHLVLGGRCPDLPIAHNKEVDAVACGHKPMGVQHEPFICAGSVCLQAAAGGQMPAAGRLLLQPASAESPGSHSEPEPSTEVQYNCT